MLAVGHIDAGPDVTDKRAILIKPWHSNVENPSIFSVVPPEPVLHSDPLTPIKGLRVRIHASPQIFWVNPFCPAVPKLVIDRSPGEVQPRSVKVRAELIGARHPDQHGRCIRHQSETLLAFSQNGLLALAFADVAANYRRADDSALAVPYRRHRHRYFNPRAIFPLLYSFVMVDGVALP